ncbi:hypothetical protein Agub_g13366 [Astrephomene gubernaculifera]|uniref:Chromo domain-containing protein n=1 Tax=Astrephomene gubernaculifera TaxID=47775 RepID=A0AAD3E2B4_9CHLO|nr:hypothetical protein Agub_g13366 [Astrephomene gubernaculifera]
MDEVVRGRTRFFLIKWKGFELNPEAHWEPSRNISPHNVARIAWERRKPFWFRELPRAPPAAAGAAAAAAAVPAPAAVPSPAPAAAAADVFGAAAAAAAAAAYQAPAGMVAGIDARAPAAAPHRRSSRVG